MEKLSLGTKGESGTFWNPLRTPPYSTHYVSSTCAVESSEDHLRGGLWKKSLTINAPLLIAFWLSNFHGLMNSWMMSQTHPCTKVIDVHQVTLLLSWTQLTKTFRKEETKLKTSATAGGPAWEFHSINYHENSLKTSFHPDSTLKGKEQVQGITLISVIGSSSGVVPSTDSITLPQEPAGVGLRSKPIAKQNQEDSEVSSIVNHNSSKSKRIPNVLSSEYSSNAHFLRSPIGML
ncbi:hypothetical protein OIU85_022637 [Salix viminalis]|uniref:Uncharacterized protein n=1 Tax=Salix viminalis TaxID=40686 RepID=A0A9Q0Z7U9_SALVM|nr:hypothetical protein OIU85_022637 [Salix viminalis]